MGLVLMPALACTPSVTTTYSHCPVPVMLSPVDRVGGQRSATRDTGARDVLSESSSFAESNSQSGSWTEMKGPMTLTQEVLELTPNQADVDASNIVLSGVSVGTFMGIGYVKIWGAPEGRKVWVK
jgi:hypothetical protein